MNIKLRISIIILVLGIVILIVGFQTPSISTSANSISGLTASDASQTYFFQPMNVAISISSLQGSAILLVQPLNENTSPGAPVVNVSVVALDIVTFSIPTRGYYSVVFAYSNGTSVAASYVLTESGVPPDTITAGTVLTTVGAVLCVIFFIASQRGYRIGRKKIAVK
jgi:hypothetical protein